MHGFVLADHARVQRVFHAQQFVALAFEHLADRNAGPARDDLGDFFGGHLLLQQVEALGLGFLRAHAAAFPIAGIFPYWISATLARSPDAARLRSRHAPASICSLIFVRALHRGFFRFPDFVEIGKLAVELGDIGFQIGQALLRLLVLFLLQRLALDLELDQATFEPIEFFRLGIDFHADARGRFVHQVDGLVRQLAIGDVAIATASPRRRSPDR